MFIKKRRFKLKDRNTLRMYSWNVKLECLVFERTVSMFIYLATIRRANLINLKFHHFHLLLVSVNLVIIWYRLHVTLNIVYQNAMKLGCIREP